MHWGCRNCTLCCTSAQSCRLREAELTKGEGRSRDHMQTVRENPGAMSEMVTFCLSPALPAPAPAPVWDSREVSGALFHSPGLSKVTEELLMILSFRCGREGSRVSPRASVGLRGSHMGRAL